MSRLSPCSVPRRASSNALVLVVMVSFGPAVLGQDICFEDYRAGQLDHWASGAVFYQIFVRSFADSDGDGVGDFQGLIDRLDYLNDGDPSTDADLGVDALWLMPITESGSYHGYDTVDYDLVESDYGTEEDFDRLVEQAHRRGLQVVIDLVLNHCSWQHPWFYFANLSTDEPYHDWFVWREDDPGWTQPWSPALTWHRSPILGLYYYGLFHGGMPDLNYENPEVRREMTAMSLRWLDRGVDGFRLDASRHMIEAGEEAKAAGSPETYDWWREFSIAMRDKHPNVLLLGENWTSIDEIAPYYGDEPHEQLHMNFNFDLAAALIKGVASADPVPIQYALCEVATWYPDHALDATFLTNHDMIRVLTQLRDDREKARLAASLLLTLPGVPFIYYGEEIGMRNGPGDEDPEKRTPMQWTADGGFTAGDPWMVNRKADPTINVEDQRKDPNSLLNHYRRLIHLRHAHPALARGAYRPLAVKGDGSGHVLAFTRQYGDERVLVIANLDDQMLESIEVELTHPVGSRAVELFPRSSQIPTTNGRLGVQSISPLSVVVFSITT